MVQLSVTNWYIIKGIYTYIFIPSYWSISNYFEDTEITRFKAYNSTVLQIKQNQKFPVQNSMWRIALYKFSKLFRFSWEKIVSAEVHWKRLCLTFWQQRIHYASTEQYSITAYDFSYLYFCEFYDYDSNSNPTIYVKTHCHHTTNIDSSWRCRFLLGYMPLVWLFVVGFFFHSSQNQAEFTWVNFGYIDYILSISFEK